MQTGCDKHNAAFRPNLINPNLGYLAFRGMKSVFVGLHSGANPASVCQGEGVIAARLRE